MKHLSREGCCSINFNDFTLDHGATNPNNVSMAGSTTARKKSSLSIDESFEKRRVAREKKNALKAAKRDRSRKRKIETNSDDENQPAKKTRKSRSFFAKSMFRKKKK